MPYRYLPDIATADVAFLAEGPSLDALFKSAAEATLHVMVDNVSSVRPSCQKNIVLASEDVEQLLFAFLQEIIYFKDAENLLLTPGAVLIRLCPRGYALDAVFEGEPVNLHRHNMIVDVKAVTMHLFRVTRVSDGWEALVVLDI